MEKIGGLWLLLYVLSVFEYLLICSYELIEIAFALSVSFLLSIGFSITCIRFVYNAFIYPFVFALNSQ